MRENLTLEKLKIHERLASLEAIIKDALAQVRKDVEKHDLIINGHEKPGLKSVVEHLQESEQKRSKTMRALGTAVTLLVLNFVKDVLVALFKKI